MMDDLTIARKYISKASKANHDGYEFKLSFTSFKNMMRSKKCKATGLTLTNPKKDGSRKFTDRSIDRLDNKKGYVKGNVVALCSGANTLKAMFENDQNPLTPEMAIKVAKFTKKI